MDKKIKILTLNCFGIPFFSPQPMARMKKIAQSILTTQADIVCLQEVFLPWHKNILIKMLRDVYPYYFVPRNGCLFTGGGVAFFSKHPILEKEFIKFRQSGQWFNITCFDKLAQKGYQLIKVDLAGEPLYFINAHTTINFDHIYEADFWVSKFIKKQLDEIGQSLKNISPSAVALIAGDLNLPPSSGAFLEFMAENKIIDLTPSDQPTRFVNYYNNEKLFDTIAHFYKSDYILYRVNTQPKFDFKYVFTGKDLVSDHCGVLVDLEI